MFEKPAITKVEQVPSATEQLSAYIESLPNNHDIRGQVQIEVPGSDGVYMDSALYGFKNEGGVITIKVAHEAGKIIEYVSAPGSVDKFALNGGGTKCKVVFPGFTLKTPTEAEKVNNAE